MSKYRLEKQGDVDTDLGEVISKVLAQLPDADRQPRAA
jgi:hypothetical protein